MVAKCQRLVEVVRQRLEAAEMTGPGFVAEIEADPFGPAVIYKALLAFGKARRLDRVIEVRPEVQDLRIGTVSDVAQAATCFIFSSAELSGSSAEMVATNLPERSNSRTVLVCIIC